jgi:hypothetical protein
MRSVCLAVILSALAVSVEAQTASCAYVATFSSGSGGNCTSYSSCYGNARAEMQCGSFDSNGRPVPGYGHLEIHGSIHDDTYGFLVADADDSCDCSDPIGLWLQWDETLNHCYGGGVTGWGYDYASESTVYNGVVYTIYDCCDCSLYTALPRQVPSACSRENHGARVTEARARRDTCPRRSRPREPSHTHVLAVR